MKEKIKLPNEQNRPYSKNEATRRNIRTVVGIPAKSALNIS
jgi:hypothetical protein